MGVKTVFMPTWNILMIDFYLNFTFLCIPPPCKMPICLREASNYYLENISTTLGYVYLVPTMVEIKTSDREFIKFDQIYGAIRYLSLM